MGLQGWGGSVPQPPPRAPFKPTYNSLRLVRPPQPDAAGSTPGLICWGSTGDMPTAEAMPSVGFQIQGEAWQEWGRESKLVRVENPENESQYVMEDRPTQIKFNAQGTGGGSPAANTSNQTPGGIAAYPPNQQRGFVPESSQNAVTPRVITQTFKE